VKRILLALSLSGALLSAAPLYAEETAAPTTTATVTEVAPAAATPAVVAAPAAAEAAPVAAAPAPTANKGDDAFLMMCSAFVILMSLPGLALFYGGLVRKKNMLSVLMQVFTVFSVITVLWMVYGYSVAFTEGNAFFGSLNKVFLSGVTADSLTASWNKATPIHEMIYIVFQGAFAAITCCLIVGAFAERAKFAGILAFMVIWFTISYLPMAHMVWYWAGPDAYKDADAAAAAAATAGWLFQKGALDFAGGTVVHINAAVAGLVGAYVIGKRLGYGREAMLPHNMVMTMIGSALLWFGWFGFNAGSALEANGVAGLAFLNTWLATAAAAVSWMVTEWIFKSKPSMLGAASGAVAGLVAITPACGFVGASGALAIGLIAGVVCLWGVHSLKRILGADDALDVFGVHGVGGIVGALLTGVFAAPSLGGLGIWDYVANGVAADYSILGQVKIQAIGVLTTVVWSGVTAFIAFKLVDITIGLRVSEEEERIGLDVTSHGERAYND
jgi:Amt family ammonium transporter